MNTTPHPGSIRQWLTDCRTAYRLRGSNWIIPEWYWQNYPEEFHRLRHSGSYRLGQSAIPLCNRIGRFFAHPAWHYVRRGAAAGCNPSLWFNTTAYCAAFPELRPGNINPLAHYLDSGSAQAFPVAPAPALSPVTAPQIRQQVNEQFRVTDAERLPDAPLPSGRIAVHIHLYYLSMAPFLAEALRRIPANFDLYVSLPATVQPEDAERVFGSLPHLGTMTLRTVSNRGRNFTPLLLEFGEALSHYDFVCHLHTKRSPHTRKLADWGPRLITRLLESADAVTRILARLNDDAKFVYPALPERWDPDPLTGWNANWEAAAALQTRLGFDPAALPPVIEFPHGGMFWTRGSVLRLLSGLPLEWNDFPEEPIPPDGTAAHAVERLILFWTQSHPGGCLRLSAPARQTR